MEHWVDKTSWIKELVSRKFYEDPYAHQCGKPINWDCVGRYTTSSQNITAVSNVTEQVIPCPSRNVELLLEDQKTFYSWA